MAKCRCRGRFNAAVWFSVGISRGPGLELRLGLVLGLWLQIARV